ncbi:type II toxin-antitoxin system prevent-host-death family antitoxin [Polymorphobacter sp. PAMC 29334]|uniref:type II toxin-antitoxin system Phd/YefM family antitoxin n=1 Tax=Polymorphobacter sp. PAMC 29334 TaxID=2862331 RepID=UPI001C75A665|nr:type II toxin-antitoxin system prevent-host-death family antitoxin [Polymorphobacter sp. PAMC 29334]QYE34402.1 type II toxin-antitoxin system prevent-host-death family antitoxin [Polymorphobacter sp. PAMC 29334]
MTIVNVLEAKTNLSRLIADVEAGGEVIIARNNKPVVRLVLAGTGGLAEATLAWQPGPATPRVPGRLATPKSKRRFGSMKDLVAWDDRFNDPLPADELALWNGEGE